MSITPSQLTYYYYFIQSRLNGLVLDVRGFDYSPKGQIQTYPQKDTSSADNQLWYFVDEGNGQYTIHAKLNGLVIDGGNGEQGTQLITNPANGDVNQMWSLQFDGNYAFISSASGSGLVFDIKANHSDPRALVQLYPKKDSGTNNQEWQFIPASV